MRLLNGSAATIVVVVTAGCVAGGAIKPVLEHPTEADIARLSQEPTELTLRNLCYGPGGRELMPDPSTPFVFVSADHSGYSPGFDQRGPDGIEWSVTLGREAQPEVASSRILWPSPITSRPRMTSRAGC